MNTFRLDDPQIETELLRQERDILLGALRVSGERCDSWRRFATEQKRKSATAANHIAQLLKHIDANTCCHEETYRGGAIWTICSSCGKKWADDEGGFAAYEEPPAIASAREFVLGTQKDIR